jgi:hypothetical protein
MARVRLFRGRADSDGDAQLATLLDGHVVHSQFSWDAPAGAMLESCDRAVALGLGGIRSLSTLT